MYILSGSGLGEAPSRASTNCSAISVHRFDKQPADLRRVLAKSFKDPAEWFDRLDRESKFALTEIFNRMCRYGVWRYVRLILKIGPGEAPVLMADRVFQVPGRTPSIYFMGLGKNALIEALMATRRFCRAHGLGASQHPGQITLREISGSDSLHISIGPGDKFDAHIDKYSPDRAPGRRALLQPSVGRRPHPHLPRTCPRGGSQSNGYPGLSGAPGTASSAVRDDATAGGRQSTYRGHHVAPTHEAPSTQGGSKSSLVCGCCHTN